MIDSLNRIRNSDFRAGARSPRNWEWRAQGRTSIWQPAAHAGNGDTAGVRIRNGAAGDRCAWAQDFTIKKDQHYRIEALVSCACPDSAGGLVLTLTRFDEAGKPLPTLETAPLHSAHRFTLRQFLKPLAQVRRAELAIELRGAGSAEIHDVRVLPVLEPDARSHPWAVPAPPFVHPAPVAVRRVCVLTTHQDRPLVHMLRAYFGPDAVVVRASATWHRALDDADAVFILDGPLPARFRKLRGVLAFAANRIVIASLPAAERITEEHLVTRLVSQVDDPLHARVAHADFLTAGFALHDIFPFAGRADDSTRQTQRQFRTNSVYREYCARHQLYEFLQSETDSEAGSEKPIALFHRTPGGAVIFMDVEPAESAGTSFDEATLAAQIIFNALGAPSPRVGQYVSPARDSEELLHHLRDTVERYPELTFAEPNSAADPHAPQLILLGSDVETLGLPLAPRPALFIRSGLTGIDTAGIYGVLLWLKQLLRPAPYSCPYAKLLDRALRVAWLPLAGRLHTWGGWSPNATPRHFPIDIEFETGSISAVIDITTAAGQDVRVLTAGASPTARRLRDALPLLANRLLAGRHFYHAVPRGAPASRRTEAQWRVSDLKLECLRDDRAFDDPWQRSARAAGAELIRIELPATATDPTAHSIWQTDWAVTLLELTAGLLLGVVLVNRDHQPLTVNLPDSLRDLLDCAVLRSFRAPDIDRPAPQPRGGKLTIPSAHALIAIR